MLCLRAGLSLEEFHALTPYQSSLHIRAWVKNRKDDQLGQMLAAYHNAWLGMVDPQKFPSFEEFSGRKIRKKQTGDEASAAILIWARKNGLKDETDG